MTLGSHRFEPVSLGSALGGADLLIERVDALPSTSAALLARPVLLDAAGRAAVVEAGRDPAEIGAIWLIADHQTGGHGRRGRSWQSDPGSSLAASLGLEATLPSEPGALTLIAGAAVARTLEAFGARPRLKWPNDLYLVGRDGRLAKAGGILCETRALDAGAPATAPAAPGVDPRAARRWRLVIGCGLNLFPSATTRPGRPGGAGAPAPAPAGMAGRDGRDASTGVQAEGGVPLGVPSGVPSGAASGVSSGVPPVVPPGHLFDHADPVLAERLGRALGVALVTAIFEALDGGIAAGLAAWQRHDLLAGQRVAVHGPAGVEIAIARGIDDRGRLLVDDPATPGRRRALVAEEVSIRQLDG